MTIGFAATYFEKDQAAFLIAADSRYSAGGQSADMALKTYALGRQTGAVGAGSALCVSAAAELTRGVAEDHDRLTPRAPINFYSTVRFFSFCLDRIERENPWSPGSEVALAGFLENGSPALAKILTRKGQKTAVFLYAPKRCGSLITMVGQRNAKNQIAAAVSRAFLEGRQNWTEHAAATIWYLAKHDGAPSIGGGPAVAVCSRGNNIYWPFVVVEGNTYLRGFDVTQSMRDPAGEGVVRLTYDEAWHSETEQNRTIPEVRLNEGFLSLSRYVEGWLQPRELFEWKVTPDELARKPDLSAERSVIVIARPGEMSGLPDAGVEPNAG